MVLDLIGFAQNVRAFEVDMCPSVHDNSKQKDIFSW